MPTETPTETPTKTPLTLHPPPCQASLQDRAYWRGGRLNGRLSGRRSGRLSGHHSGPAVDPFAMISANFALLLGSQQGPTDWKIQDLPPEARRKISSEPSTRTLLLRGILKVKIENFKRDWEFQASDWFSLRGGPYHWGQTFLPTFFRSGEAFFRVGFWQNRFFADFYFWAAGFFRGFCRRIISPHLCGKKCP